MALSSAQKREASGFSETLVPVYQTTQCYTPAGSNLYDVQLFWDQSGLLCHEISLITMTYMNYLDDICNLLLSHHGYLYVVSEKYSCEFLIDSGKIPYICSCYT
jgi:hypothetical protein